MGMLRNKNILLSREKKKCMKKKILSDYLSLKLKDKQRKMFLQLVILVTALQVLGIMILMGQELERREKGEQEKGESQRKNSKTKRKKKKKKKKFFFSEKKKKKKKK